MSLLFTILLFAFALAGVAEPAERPTFAPPSGAKIDRSLAFTEASGMKRSFGAFLGGKPAVLIIGYNKCPNLCGLTQSIVADALEKADLPADSYSAIFLSIDPTETPVDAAAAKARLAQIVGRGGVPAWRFLIGAPEAIDGVATSLGYSFEQRQRIEEFVHPLSVAILTPDGKLSRLLPATVLSPRDLRLALVEASEGKIGTIADQVRLFCAGFDFSKGQYTPIIGMVLEAGGLATLLALSGLVLMLARGRRA